MRSWCTHLCSNIESVKQVTPVDERVLKIRLDHTYGFITAVAVNAPPEYHELRDKQWFNQKLDSVVGICSAGDVLVVQCDFNVEPDSIRARYELCLDDYGFGTWNENSQFFPDFRYQRWS